MLAADYDSLKVKDKGLDRNSKDDDIQYIQYSTVQHSHSQPQTFTPCS